MTISFIDPVLNPAVVIGCEKSPGSIATEFVSRRKCCVFEIMRKEAGNGVETDRTDSSLK